MTDLGEAQVAAPRLRFPRLSLGGMIAVVLVVGGWLGWFIRGVQIEAATPWLRSRLGRLGQLRLGIEKGRPDSASIQKIVGAGMAGQKMCSTPYFDHVIKVRQYAFGNLEAELAHIGRHRRLGAAGPRVLPSQTPGSGI